MKKRISLFLIAILLFCLCIPAGADHVTPNKSELDQALIVHMRLTEQQKENGPLIPQPAERAKKC